MTGVVLTKLDGTAKGGVAVAIAARSQAPDPVRRRRRGHRRSDSVLARRLRRRAVRGEVVDDAADAAGAAACRARARAHESEPDGRRRIVSPDGAIVGDGWHQRAGSRTLKCTRSTRPGRGRAAPRSYCTLEPCCHHGRTGPCIERIIAAGIARVVAAIGGSESAAWPAADSPYLARARRRGRRRRRGRGAGASESRVHHHVRDGTPVGDPEGGDEPRRPHRRGARCRGREITSSESRPAVQRLRAEVDAVAVGVGNRRSSTTRSSRCGTSTARGR